MDKMREEFESWYESRFGDSKLIWLQSVQEYDYTSVQCMWQAWKASRAALTNELQQRNAEIAAQVVLIRDAISAVRDSSYTKGFGYPDTSQLKAQRGAWQKLNESLEAAPAQCLAEIKAQAVEDAGKYLLNLVTAPPSLHFASADALYKRANQLRQQAVKGE